MKAKSYAIFFTAGMLIFQITIASELELKITLIPSESIVAQPVMAHFEMRNASDEVLILPGKVRGYPSQFFKLFVFDNQGNRVEYIGERVIYVAPTEKNLIKFEPNEKMEWTVAFTQQFAIVNEGIYKIVGNYDIDIERCQSFARLAKKGMWHGKVTAETMLVVHESRGIDKQAYDYFYNKHKIRLEPVVKKWNDKNTKYGDKPKSLDYEVRLEVNRELKYDGVSDLIEKFPSSLYTAYALYTKYGLMRERVGFDPRAKELAKNLELIPRHHPDFVFIDEVYEMLGEFYSKEGDIAKARFYYEKSAKTAKDPERKARAEEFLKTLEEQK